MLHFFPVMVVVSRQTGGWSDCNSVRYKGNLKGHLWRLMFWEKKENVQNEWGSNVARQHLTFSIITSLFSQGFGPPARHNHFCNEFFIVF